MLAFGKVFGLRSQLSELIEQYKEIKIQKGHSEEESERMAKAQILDQWEV